MTCNVVHCTCCFENNLEDISPFCGATDAPFLDFRVPGFGSQSESPYLYAPLPAYNRFLRFTPNGTSRWPTWQLSHFIHILAHKYCLGSSPGLSMLLPHSMYKTDALPAELRRPRLCQLYFLLKFNEHRMMNLPRSTVSTPQVHYSTTQSRDDSTGYLVRTIEIDVRCVCPKAHTAHLSLWYVLTAAVSSAYL